MKISRIPLLLILFTGFGISVFAQSGTRNGEFNASSVDELNIEVNYGMGIRIEGSQTQRISYTYEFEGNKEAYERYVEQFDPKFQKQDGYARLSIIYPDRKNENVSYLIKKNRLTIRVPSSVKLNLSSRYSEIDVDDIDRDVEIYNRSGSVKVENIGQSLRISNEYGDVATRNIQGNVTIDGRSSYIDVTNITGTVLVRSDYSKMNISKIDGDVELENKSGTINAFEIKGNFKSEADYTELELTNIDGITTIYSNSGKVSVDGIHLFSFSGEYTDVMARNIKNADMVGIQGRSATIKLDNIEPETVVNGEYLEIEATNLKKDLELTNRSGKVKVNQLYGSFSYEGEYSDVVLNDFYGNMIGIESRSGDVSIEALNQLNKLSVDAEYADITLSMEKAFAGNVNLSTTYGKINHNFKLANLQQIKESQKLTIDGTTQENGSGSIRIVNRNGNITIQD